MTIWLWLSTPSIPIWKLLEKKPPVPAFFLNSYDYMPFFFFKVWTACSLKKKKKICLLVLSLILISYTGEAHILVLTKEKISCFSKIYWSEAAFYLSWVFKIKVINQSKMILQLFW